tara:strand:+ start:289 stop:507 length:219 start_codon:yes stop_codon:yes gene_type:complete
LGSSSSFGYRHQRSSSSSYGSSSRHSWRNSSLGSSSSFGYRHQRGSSSSYGSSRRQSWRSRSGNGSSFGNRH